LTAKRQRKSSSRMVGKGFPIRLVHPAGHQPRRTR
jgi:hypothetical protein